MIKSLKENGKGILLMLISSICVCTGQLFWKLSSKELLFLILAHFVLHEEIDILTYIGISIIFIGVVLIGGGDN